MDRSEWGIKRICLKCGARFYDFNKSPITCPVCNTIFDPESSLKKKSKNSVKKEDDENENIEDFEETLDTEDPDSDIDDVDEDVDEDISIDNGNI